MDINKFNYNLPKELIAQRPLERRDESRLLIINRASEEILHTEFKALLNRFNPGDAMVLNDTRVKPVRLIGEVRQRPVDILLAERLLKNQYLVKANPGRKLKPGTQVIFEDGRFSAVCKEDEAARKRGMKLLVFDGEDDIEEMLDDIGTMPLPPYIKRLGTRTDAERYQTVYAKNPGAIAAPTAGLHFTQNTLNELKNKGVNIVHLTLHVGLGTFAPVSEEDITRHRMHEESYELSAKAAKDIEQVKNAGNNVCAVGTTVCRVLEACVKEQENFSLQARKGETDLFIYPPYPFKAVDMLLTNFHLPKTTLLMLVCAFAGRNLVMEAYRQAIEKKYRFFSYGDAMLII